MINLIKEIVWTVVNEFNATMTAEVISWWLVSWLVFPGFLTPVLTQLFFPKPPTTFSHASAEMRGEHTPERKFALTGDQTQNHQVRSLTWSPLSHPDGAYQGEVQCTRTITLGHLLLKLGSIQQE